MPALAADTGGARLGQGGGWYDRSLAGSAGGDAKPRLLVAVVHDDELFDATTDPLPVESHDLRVDAVLTPTRWVETA
jgi:5-formyltetrahydrofolate cyclo-ligase